jgi:hypothetical protein
MSALANGFCDGRGSWRCSRWSSGYCRDGWSLHAPKVAQCNDGIEEYPAMTNGTDADFLQVLLGQIRETHSSILLSRNAASYSSRPRLRSQTTTSIMTSPTQGWRASWSCPERVSTGVRDNRTLHVSEARRLGDRAAIADVAPLASIYSCTSKASTLRRRTHRFIRFQASAICQRMSKKGKHHYIPVFYLKQWTGQDGRLCEFSKPYDRVKAQRVHPDATAFVHGLNTIEGLPAGQEQYLEDVFFKIADNFAARALRILLSEKTWHFSPKERSGWSRFIVSLMLRNPESMQKHREVAVALFKEALPRIELEYAKDRKPTDPPTYLEYAQQQAPNPAGRTIAVLFQNLIDNAELGNYINQMRWMVLRDGSPRYRLLTSDRPIVITNGIKHFNSQILLPISPYHLFVATNNDETEKFIADVWGRGEVIPQINERVACQSRKYVYADDHAQLNFVSKRLGLRHTADPIENLTREQMIASAKSARQPSETSGSGSR